MLSIMFIFNHSCQNIYLPVLIKYLLTINIIFADGYKEKHPHHGGDSHTSNITIISILTKIIFKHRLLYKKLIWFIIV